MVVTVPPDIVVVRVSLSLRSVCYCLQFTDDHQWSPKRRWTPSVRRQLDVSVAPHQPSEQQINLRWTRKEQRRAGIITRQRRFEASLAMRCTAAARHSDNTDAAVREWSVGSGLGQLSVYRTVDDWRRRSGPPPQDRVTSNLPRLALH